MKDVELKDQLPCEDGCKVLYRLVPGRSTNFRIGILTDHVFGLFMEYVY